MRIGVVAPSSRFSEEAAGRVLALAAAEFPAVELVFHPQCFLTHKHFAGPDEARAAAFVEYANDPGFDALWFARGGYGSNRFAEDAIARLGPAARDKLYMGYSDGGFLLAGLYRAGFPHLAHGPMPQDAMREPGDPHAGEAAVRRALAWLAHRDPDSLEPGLEQGRRHAAFNLTVFSQLLGTALEPDLSDHILLLEDVSEHTYRTDRTMFHVTGNAGVRKVAGMRFGRFTDVPENDPPFGETDEEVTRFWCQKVGIPWLGRADIGHDSANRIVPFGRF